VELDADRRRHALIELAIRDRKQGAGLRHCPSGRFLANAAWLVIATLADNLLRWVAALGLGHRGLVAAKTLRCRLGALPGRLTRSARRCQLHLPNGWPWTSDFTQALGRLRALTTSPPQPPLGILR
jgi:DDE family transposase